MSLNNRISMSFNEAREIFIKLIQENPNSKYFEIVEHMNMIYLFNEYDIRRYYWKGLNTGFIEANNKWELTYNKNY